MNELLEQRELEHVDVISYLAKKYGVEVLKQLIEDKEKWNE